MNMNMRIPNLQNVVKGVYGKVSNIPQSQDDAVQLHKAFKGTGCDTSAVISILARRNASQRSVIEKEYKKMYSEDLKERISSKLSGHIQKAILLWMPEPVERDAIILREAFATKTDLTVVAQVLCSKTPSQLQSLRNMYHTVYGIYLEHEIISHTSGYFEKLLLAYLSISHGDAKEINKLTATSDAIALHAAGENKKTFIITFTGRNRAHLVAVGSEYQRLYGSTLNKAILSQNSGPFEQALLTILECAENTAGYFAKVLQKTKHKTGTDDATLIRVIVSRTEIDMQLIKEEYQKENHKSLQDVVQSMTSSYYSTFLLSLLGTI